MPRKSKPAIATPEEVLATFTQIMRGDMTETVVRKGPSGEETVRLPPKVSERSKAAEMLGKGYGLFSEKEPPAEPREEIAAQIEAALRRLSACAEANVRRG